MISHKYKCIFIHMPRTGGSFIEKILINKDQWLIDPKIKHLTARQAKLKYKKYWNNYFKFSFVRHPLSRFKSMMKYSEFFFGEKNINSLKIEHINFYKKKFNYPNLIETDLRYFSPKKSKKNKQNQPYLNFLNEKLDYIGLYENFEEDFKVILNKINFKFYFLKKFFIFNKEQTKFKNKVKYKITNLAKKEIIKLHSNDISYFYGDKHKFEK